MMICGLMLCIEAQTACALRNTLDVGLGFYKLRERRKNREGTEIVVSVSTSFVKPPLQDVMGGILLRARA
jgi:hypothetical protein